MRHAKRPAADESVRQSAAKTWPTGTSDSSSVWNARTSIWCWPADVIKILGRIEKKDFELSRGVECWHSCNRSIAFLTMLIVTYRGPPARVLALQVSIGIFIS